MANEGYQELWEGRLAGADGAIASFRQAAQADPAMPYRWSDLGMALAAAGRNAEARLCFERSRQLGPHSAQLALRAANFYFQTGDTSVALRTGAGILREVPDFDQMLFVSYFRLGGEPNVVREVGIGDNRRAGQAYFRFLLPRAGVRSLSEAWQWLETRGLADKGLARAWAAWLLRQNRGGDAVDVWARHLPATGAPWRRPNFIFNPGFEADRSAFEIEPGGDGFEWHLTACPGVRMSVDEKTRHTGANSLRLDFDAADNLEFHHVSQSVWLVPGHYRLGGWLRTAGFSTDQGVGLRLADPTRPSLVETPALNGSHDWTWVSAPFTVGAPARLVSVGAFRHSSWNFDNQPRGTVWLDDIELIPVR